VWSVNIEKDVSGAWEDTHVLVLRYHKGEMKRIWPPTHHMGSQVEKGEEFRLVG
jgi:hypothetical protein